MSARRMPLARALMSRDAGDALVLIDSVDGTSHALRGDALAVWRCCDGATPIDRAAAALGLPVGRVELIVAGLVDAGLADSAHGLAVSRRRVLQGSGVLVAAGLVTVALPAANAAATGESSQVSVLPASGSPSSPYTFVVPSGVTSLTIVANGGTGGGSMGGAGATITTLELIGQVEPGDTLYMYAGYGGGNGGTEPQAGGAGSGGGSGGGGGGSFVWDGPPATGTLLVAAGGGGGIGQGGSGSISGGSAAVTSGSQPAGAVAGGSGGGSAGGHGGGKTSAGTGGGGSGGDGSGSNGGSGAYAVNNGSPMPIPFFGGGGGSGYYGGGGSVAESNGAAGGGGAGSSYCIVGYTISAYAGSNGSITITYS